MSNKETIENKFLTEHSNSITINFPQQILPKNFDRILYECYGKTLEESNKVVKFDFSKVSWCSVFELSLISIWMLNVKKQDITVIFVFPVDRAMSNFLSIYRFNLFLDKIVMHLYVMYSTLSILFNLSYMLINSII